MSNKYSPNNLLKKEREQRSWTHADVAEQIGVPDPHSVGRWERGMTFPGPRYRLELCRLFGKSMAELGLLKPKLDRSDDTLDHPPSWEIPLYDVAIPFALPIKLIGREADLARIKAQLLGHTDGSVVLSALNGIPGVGKTSLAIAIAHDAEIRASFRDGILWAGLGPTPNIPALLSRWAGLLGVSEAQFSKPGEDQKRQMLRRALGTRSVLLVLDDIWGLEDVLELNVGGRNCAYLVTTRSPVIATHLGVGNAMMIEELDEEQSIHLLRVLAPGVFEREEARVRELVHAVGGLPLALTLLGNYLRKQTYGLSARRTIAALERLSSVNERFKISEPQFQAGTHPSPPSSVAISMSSIIGVSDYLLSPLASEALYALSVFPPKPESFSEEAALSVVACTTHELDELLDAGLLQYQSADRYRLHQTIADYARLHLDEKTEHVVTLRLLVYMQQYIEQHSKEYELLEQEIALILSALDKAVTGEAFQSQVVPFVCAAVPFLLMRGYIGQAERFLGRAYQLATASQESANIATVLFFLGEISQKRGDLSRAKDLYKQGKVLAESINDITLMVAFYHGIGRMCRKMGDYQEAEALLLEGMTFARTIEQPELVCDIYMTLAALYANRADYKLAEEYAREGLSIARQLGDREQIVALLINLGCSLQASPEKPASLHEALLIAREIKSDERCCLVLINLGDWYTNGPVLDFPRAEACLREAISIGEQLGISEWTSMALSGLTAVLRLQGRLSEAQTCIQEAYVLAKEIESPRCMCIAQDEIGNLALVRGDMEQALEAFEEMLRLCPQGDSEMQAMSLFGLGCTYEQLEQWERALSCGQQSLELIQQKNQMQHIERVQTWYASLVQRLSEAEQSSLSAETCICGTPLVRASGIGRTRRYCSDRCRKRGQREREASDRALRKCESRK